MDDQSDELRIPFELRPNNYQPNFITESKQEFTEMEKKVIVLAVNQFHDVAQFWKKGKNVTLTIPYNKLTSKHHAEVSALANTLSRKSIVVQDTLNFTETKFESIILFPRIRGVKLSGKRYLELTMLSEVVPSFIELGKRYTSYNMKLMLLLSSVYAQRMYEIIMMFYGWGQKEFTYEVARLRTALNYPPEHDYYDFKRKAIQVSQQEIENKIGMYFEFMPHKKSGKSVTELRFIIKSRKNSVDEKA